MNKSGPIEHEADEDEVLSEQPCLTLQTIGFVKRAQLVILFLGSVHSAQQ